MSLEHVVLKRDMKKGLDGAEWAGVALAAALLIGLGFAAHAALEWVMASSHLVVALPALWVLCMAWLGFCLASAIVSLLIR